LVELLLDKRVDLDSKDHSRQIPLHWAVKNGNENITELDLNDNYR